MTRYLLFVALGMFLMYIILKILSKREVTSSKEMTQLAADMVSTQQFTNLIKTAEAREFVKTTEFRRFMKSLAAEQLNALSRSLVTYEPKL